MILSLHQKKSMKDIASYLVENIMIIKKCSSNDALELLLKTAVYTALMDPETELYLESREAVFDMLKEELNGNPLGLLNI